MPMPMLKTKKIFFILAFISGFLIYILLDIQTQLDKTISEWKILPEVWIETTLYSVTIKTSVIPSTLYILFDM